MADWADREAELRGEAADLEQRLRQAEGAAQALQSGAGDATRPLLRQIESMAAAAAQQQAVARETEQQLRQQLRAAQQQSAGTAEAQRRAEERAAELQAAAAAAEQAAAAARDAAAAAAQRHSEEQARCQQLQGELAAADKQQRDAAAAAAKQLREQEQEVQHLQEQVWEAQEQLRSLAAERATLQKRAGPEQGSTPAGTLRQQPGGGGAASLGAGRQHSHGSLHAAGAREAAPANGTLGPGAVESDDEMDALVKSMTSLAPTSSGTLAAAGGELEGLRPRLPVSTASAADARLALVEAQLAAAEQQRDVAALQLVAALQRADAAAADAARCAALQHRLQELEASGALGRAVGHAGWMPSHLGYPPAPVSACPCCACCAAGPPVVDAGAPGRAQRAH